MKVFRFFVTTKSMPVLIADVSAETREQAEALLKARADVQLYKKGKHPVEAELKAVFDIVEDEATTGSHRDIQEIARGMAQLLEAYLPKNAHIGYTLFLVDTAPAQSGGFLSYVSNLDRADMVRGVEEWLVHQRAALEGKPS